MPFDTTAVPNGTHHLVVSVLDPAGNSATVLDKEIDVENGPPAAPASPAAPVSPKPVPRPAPKPRKRVRVTLKIESRPTGEYRTVHFSGRLLGSHIPRRGKRVVLEVRLRNGSWLKVGTVETGAHGRFHTTYGFMFLGPGLWQARVLCEPQRDYPFAGTSRVVRVRVG